MVAFCLLSRPERDFRRGIDPMAIVLVRSYLLWMSQPDREGRSYFIEAAEPEWICYESSTSNQLKIELKARFI